VLARGLLYSGLDVDRRAWIALVAGLALWLAVPAVASAATADQVAARVAELEAERAEKVADKAELSKRLAESNSEVKALKRRKSSWRRDRELRSALKTSQTIATRLSAVHKQIRSLHTKLTKARRALVKAVDLELSAAKGARRAQLSKWRAGAMRALKPRSKKIVLPSDAIDPLADADELAEQAALVEQTLKDLDREEKLLARRESNFEKMAKLQRARDRADEAEMFDDNRPRRTTGRQADPTNDNRGGGADLAGDGAPGAPEADGDDAGITGEGAEPPSDPSFDSDPTIVLVEVIDADALDALKQAERSGNPKVKARAARTAREQVRGQRERLERQRKKIQARIRALEK
jgi:hypothetical protein